MAFKVDAVAWNTFAAQMQGVASQMEKFGMGFSYGWSLWEPPLDPATQRRLHNFCVHHGRLVKLAKKRWSPCGRVVGCGGVDAV